MNFQYFLKIRDIKNSPWFGRIDFFGQTVIFCSIPVMLILGKRSEWVIAILAAQYAMGVWQMVSSLVSVVSRGSAFNSKIRHFLISISYLLLFAFLITLSKSLENFYDDQGFTWILAAIGFFGPPWMLAIYYYIITWRLVLPRQKKHSSFLPHINF